METIYIILIVLSAVVVFAILLYLWRRRRKSQGSNNQQNQSLSTNMGIGNQSSTSSSTNMGIGNQSSTTNMDIGNQSSLGISNDGLTVFGSSSEREALRNEIYKEIMSNIDTSDDVIVQPSISYPAFIGYWKNTKSFGIKGSNEEYFDSNSILESNRPSKTGNSFSKSLSLANTRGHKFMALKRDCHSDSQKNKKCKLEGGEMLSFNQLNYSNKFEYNYATPSLDQPDKNSGCSKEICKKQFELDHELWAVYQLYK
jgi:hypothetical protein